MKKSCLLPVIFIIQQIKSRKLYQPSGNQATVRSHRIIIIITFVTAPTSYQTSWAQTSLTDQRRNDLRLRGTSSLAFTGYDLKVYSLGDNEARSTAVPIPPNYKLADFCFGRCVGWLDKVGNVVERRAPGVVGGIFKPLILSIGGLMSHGMGGEWKSWRDAMPERVFLRMQRRISVELVKARARTLVL